VPFSLSAQNHKNHKNTNTTLTLNFILKAGAMEFATASKEEVVGEYEEKEWIEMLEDEDDDINCLGMFDDPGMHLSNVFQSYQATVVVFHPTCVFDH
jgi:hypothetical protein